MKKKYFLFLLGNFDITTIELIKEKLNVLKFNIIDEDYQDSCIVYIIESEISVKNDTTRIEGIKDIDAVGHYYIFPTSSLISSYMPDSFKNLVQTSFLQKLFESSIDLSGFENQITFIRIDNIDNVPQKKKYTIDEVLQKINDSGIDSLTEDERNFLNECSSEI